MTPRAWIEVAVCLGAAAVVIFLTILGYDLIPFGGL